MRQASLVQVAISVADVRRSHDWYRDVFGFSPAGGTNLFFGPLATMVQGVPRAGSTCWWLVDAQQDFQIELFEFYSPRTRPLPDDWRPCDIGYSMFSVHVADFDGTIDRARAAGATPVDATVGEPGARRACVRDPDGSLIELMEDDPRAPSPGGRPRPRPAVPSVVRAVTLSVPDLERTARMLSEVFGLTPQTGAPLHTPEHEAAWGLPGARSRRAAFWAGDVLVEAAEYEDPVGRPWPEGYRISDRGLLNMAFGFDDRAAFEEQLKVCRGAGLMSNGPPLRVGAASVTYLNDPDGFSIELLHSSPRLKTALGFKPRHRPRFAPMAGRTTRRTTSRIARSEGTPVDHAPSTDRPTARSTAPPTAPPAANSHRTANTSGKHGKRSIMRCRRRFRKALVTGAAGRISAAVAERLAADGTELVLIDRDGDGLEAVAAKLRDRVPVECVIADFADLEALDAVAEELARRHADLDLYFGGAGVDRGQTLLQFDWRKARDDFNINTLANTVMMQHLVPGMVARGSGHVAVIASLAALIGTPYEGVYSATKAALSRLMDSFRGELRGTGVTFTTILPGFIDTPLMWANVYKHPYVVSLDEAADRIHEAVLKRRPRVYFPARERARIAISHLLPSAVADRIAKSAMNEYVARGLGRDE